MPYAGALYYEVAGKGEPLVLVPGFMDSHLSWQDIFRELSKNHRVVLFDNRGAGQSEVSPPPYTSELLVKDLHLLVQYLGFDKAHYLGHSMGGQIILQLALHHPENVKSIILANTSPKLTTVARWAIEEMGYLLKENVSLERLFRAMAPWFFSSNFLERVEENKMLLTDIQHCPSYKGYQGQFAALTSFDLTDKLKNIQAPTLIIASDQDLITPLAHSEYLTHHLPNTEMALIHDSGHNAFYEQPELFCQIVNNYLRKAPWQATSKHST